MQWVKCSSAHYLQEMAHIRNVWMQNNLHGNLHLRMKLQQYCLELNLFAMKRPAVTRSVILIRECYPGVLDNSDVTLEVVRCASQFFSLVTSENRPYTSIRLVLTMWSKIQLGDIVWARLKLTTQTRAFYATPERPNCYQVTLGDQLMQQCRPEVWKMYRRTWQRWHHNYFHMVTLTC